MKREELLNAIDEIEISDDIEEVKSKLTKVAIEFCDRYESQFNEIRDLLNFDHCRLDDIESARNAAINCSNDLH